MVRTFLLPEVAGTMVICPRTAVNGSCAQGANDFSWYPVQTTTICASYVQVCPPPLFPDTRQPASVLDNSSTTWAGRHVIAGSVTSAAHNSAGASQPLAGNQRP